VAESPRRLHARDELLHRDRLDEVVVGAQLERVDAVVLAAARGDDEDGRPDPLGPDRLDQLPAVELREHEVEDADVRVVVAQPAHGEAPVADDGDVVSGVPEVVGHPFCDQLVVLDDQHFGHVSEYSGAAGRGFARG
jgi:hypothetical protein